MGFLAKLEFTLRQGLPQEKLVALRQCIQRVHVNQPGKQIDITLHQVPATNLSGTHALNVSIAVSA